MTTVNKEFIEYTEKELVSIVMRFVNTLEEARAIQIAKDIIGLIDWNNSALMHKGLSWMAKNYLVQKKMI